MVWFRSAVSDKIGSSGVPKTHRVRRLDPPARGPHQRRLSVVFRVRNARDRPVIDHVKIFGFCYIKALTRRFWRINWSVYPLAE